MGKLFWQFVRSYEYCGQTWYLFKTGVEGWTQQQYVIPKAVFWGM